MTDIFKLLKETPYPGRGIIAGKTADGNAVTAYFIMGRSENSRNRIFEADNGTLRTRAFDESKLIDPSLIIYNAVRSVGNKTIVTNGDQTDTIFDAVSVGKSFASGLRTREFEPDKPNFTPRISALLDFDGGYTYSLSVLKCADGKGENCNRFFYEYEPVGGVGHFVHTYRGECDGVLLPFSGEPTEIAIDCGFEEFADGLWNNLNCDNKVSLFVRLASADGKILSEKIYNKNV